MLFYPLSRQKVCMASFGVAILTCRCKQSQLSFCVACVSSRIWMDPNMCIPSDSRRKLPLFRDIYITHVFRASIADQRLRESIGKGGKAWRPCDDVPCPRYDSLSA